MQNMALGGVLAMLHIPAACEHFFILRL